MRKYVTILLSIFMLFFLDGCGQTTDLSKELEPVTFTTKEELAEWKTEGFTAPEELMTGQFLWLEEYQLWEHEEFASSTDELELVYLDSGVYGELFWYLGVEAATDGITALRLDRNYVMEIYDTVTKETSIISFSPQSLGMDGMGLFDGLDMIDREHFVLRWLSYSQMEDGRYCQITDSMVYTDFRGETQVAEFWESYLKMGLMEEQVTELPLIQNVFDWRCDDKGNIYEIVSTNSSIQLYLWDKNGQLLLEDKMTDAVLAEPFRTSSGEMILAVYEGKNYNFMWVDVEARKLCSLAQIETDRAYIDQIYGMSGNDIYYRSFEDVEISIVKWNIQSGSKVQMLGFNSSGVGVNQNTMLAFREGQTPYLRVIMVDDELKEKDWITELSKQKSEDVNAVRVVNLTSSGEIVEKGVALASMEIPGIKYQYEEASTVEARDRIMAEFAQGKGPDILYVDREDLYILEEKGVLLDIAELLSWELQEDLLPGALELGTVAGTLYGLPVSVDVNTLLVSEEIWDADTWQLEDIIELMEEGVLKGALRQSTNMSRDYLEPMGTVNVLIRNCIDNSFLVDWKNRNSYFEDEKFVKLLEITATDMSSTPSHDAEKWLDGGKSIAVRRFMTVYALVRLFAYMEQENGKIIGYPTNGSVGSYLVPNGGILVVNANIERKDAARHFLEILLGDDMQKEISMHNLCVRKLVPEDYIVEMEDGRLLFMGNDSLEIPIFQDGTNALVRSKAFLENCKAQPRSYVHVMQIVNEELDAMYAEGKRPKDTAEIIDRRVQLYLDELQ